MGLFRPAAVFFDPDRHARAVGPLVMGACCAAHHDGGEDAKGKTGEAKAHGGSPSGHSSDCIASESVEVLSRDGGASRPRRLRTSPIARIRRRVAIIAPAG